MAIASGYGAKSIPMTDVSGAYQTIDLSQKVKTSFGRVPVAVAMVCRWLDFTSIKNESGFGKDTDRAGALVVAGAFERVLPSSLIAGAKAVESKVHGVKTKGAAAAG